jgi:hypothetical protein
VGAVKEMARVKVRAVEVGVGASGVGDSGGKISKGWNS